LPDIAPCFLEQAIFHGVSVESESGINRAADNAGHRGRPRPDLVSGFLPNSTLFAPNYLFRLLAV
jgi:hypothetical protein